MTNKTGFSRLIVAWLLTVSVLGFGQQTSRAPAIMVDTPTITLTTATADTTATPSTGAHTAIVQFKFGTVTGTYTTCTVQAKTTLDGTNYLNLSTAASITVTTGTTNTWTVTAKGPTSGNTSTPSTTTADGFGQLTKYTVACSGAYGTSAPVTVSVIYSPDVIASAATAAGTVAISQSGLENNVAITGVPHVIVDSGGGGGTQYTQDAPLTVATTIGTAEMCRASAAVPTDVSADNDAVLAWCLRSGAKAIQSTFAGVLASTGNGASGTGVQRVTIANDSTGIIALTTGSAQIGHLEANQSVNIAQINGVTPLMGNGASGTGAQRVTIANDSTGILAQVTLVPNVTTVGTVTTVSTVTAVTSVNAVIPGTGATNLGKAEDGTPANGDTIVPSGCIVQATLSATTSDTKYGIPKCNANSVLYFQNIFQTAADAAEDAAVATSPVPTGGVFRATSVVLDDGDAGYFAIDKDGRTLIKPYADASNDLFGLITTSMTGTTSTAVTGMGAQGASVRNYVTWCIASNAHATVGTDVILQDGSGGSTLATLPAAAAYGGTAIPFPTPLKTTANTALFAANVTTGASTKLTCGGYKGF